MFCFDVLVDNESPVVTSSLLRPDLTGQSLEDAHKDRMYVCEIYMLNVWVVPFFQKIGLFSVSTSLTTLHFFLDSLTTLHCTKVLLDLPVGK